MMSEIMRRITRLEREVERLESLEFPREIILVQDEGVTLPGEIFGEMNFMGAGVVASVNPGNDAKVDVTVGGGGTGVVGCQLEAMNVGVLQWDDEIYDPGDLWDVASPSYVNMTSSGYWAMLVGITVACTKATLVDDVDKVVMISGTVDVYYDDPGPILWNSAVFHGDAVHALTVNWAKRFANLEMMNVWRNDGTKTNPRFQATIAFVKSPPAGWNTDPVITMDAWCWVAKIGDL